MEGDPEPVKSVEAPVYNPEPIPVPRPRKSLMAPKHNIAEAAEHSLQVAAQEFKKDLQVKHFKVKRWIFG